MTNIQHGNYSIDDVVPFSKFARDCEEKGIATEHQLRWWLRHRKENGLDHAVTEIYGRIYIITPRFVNWMVLGSQK